MLITWTVVGGDAGDASALETLGWEPAGLSLKVRNKAVGETLGSP